MAARRRAAESRPAAVTPIARASGLERAQAALARREPLLTAGGTDAVRLVHGTADGLPGLVVEQLGSVLVAQFHEGALALAADDAAAVCEMLMRERGATAVYRKEFVADRSAGAKRVADLHYAGEPWLGEPAPQRLLVEEAGLRFWVRAYDGFSTGLFLEHRGNRQRVRVAAAGQRVLNLFSYTGGYSIAAAAGGAAHVSSVDVSKKFLEWSKENFAGNALALDPHRFFASDVFDFYRRAARQGRVYDLVILDPPSFARDRKSKRAFVLSEQLEPLVAGVMDLLIPGGTLLLCLNQRPISLQRMQAAIEQGAAPRRVTILETPALPVDFPGDPDFAKSLWARVD
jgi:23S rRNA (cytosine1962-C5)-methyltransferase